MIKPYNILELFIIFIEYDFLLCSHVLLVKFHYTSSIFTVFANQLMGMWSWHLFICYQGHNDLSSPTVVEYLKFVLYFVINILLLIYCMMNFQT